MYNLKGYKVGHHGHHTASNTIIAHGFMHTHNYKDESDKEVMQHGGGTPANRQTEASGLASYIEHQGQGCCLTGARSPEESKF